jgi:outer membrane protein OmpA-like peptidoglycan-associated protein
MDRKFSNSLVLGLALLLFTGLSVFGCPSPTVISLSTNRGVNTDTIELAVAGANFNKSTFVKLTKTGESDILAENVTVVSKTELTCTLNLKGKTAGLWNVAVINIGTFTKKEKPTILDNGFTIETPAPMVTGIEPRQGLNNTTVKISKLTGANFRPGAAVMISNSQMDIGAAKVMVLSDTLITCQLNLNGASPGTYNVKVSNDDNKTGFLADGFLITAPATLTPTPSPAPLPESTPTPTPLPAPVIKMIAPDRGFNNGAILTGIDGLNFDQKTTVKLTAPGIEIPGLNTKVESDLQLSCFLDLTNQPVGKYNVIITNPDGQTATLVDGFTVEVFRPAINPNKLMKPIYFNYDRWDLRPDQAPVLAADLVVLKDNPTLYLLIGGHADERGTREYNLELSSKRANTIKKYLVERGIAADRITVYAYGKDYLAKQGHGEANQKYNRRVDILMWEAPPSKEQGLKSIKL